MNNMRNYQRHEVSGEGTLKISSKPGLHGFEVVDLSASGIRLISPADIEIGSIVDIQVEITAMLTKMHFSSSGKVTKRQRSGNKFEYALKFTDLRHEKKVEIDEIVNKLLSVAKLIHEDTVH